MRAIIIGASGLIGSALERIFRQRGVAVIGTRNANVGAEGLIAFDMRKDNIVDIIKDLSPDDTIYLMSAYSNPSWIYANKCAAEALNVTRTKALIDAVQSKSPRIIFMSSVEVFDGIKGEYSEEDPANPLNYYGKMKCEIEDYLTNQYENSTIVRTGWNVGWDLTSRCVVSLTYESLLEASPRMAYDNEFSIVDVDDTARGLATLILHKDIRKIHICADAKVNRVWMARRILEKSQNNKVQDFETVPFAEIPYSEPRGRVNDLVNALSKSTLGMTYRESENIIDAKVAFLDEHCCEV
jgi:dTDP-4-dehydrorhamnose reductase